MFVFEINPSLITGESFVAIIFAAFLFVVLPLTLMFLEYRITKKNKVHGVYLIIGVLISGVVFGVFAIGVALLLLAVYFFASRMLES